MARILGPAAAWTVILYVAEPYIEQAAKNISELLKKTRASMGGHAEVLRSQMAGDEERLAQNPKTPRQVAHERACDKLRRKINNLDSTLKTYRAQRDNLKKTRDRENWIRNKFGYKNLPPSKKITALNQRIEAQLGLKDRAQQQLKALDPSYNY